MRRYDHPAQPADPYPPPGTPIAGFRYLSALWLMRPRDAVKLRTGEDADYIVARDFLVEWRPEGSEWRAIVVPAGLITDLTSVPRPFRWIVDRVGPWLEAAILHDYLYIAWQDVPGRRPTRADRRFADDMMLAAMREAGVGQWTAGAIWLAVSLLGGRTFAEPNAERYADPGTFRAPVRDFTLPRRSGAGPDA